MDADAEGISPFGLAVQDAFLYGAGWIVIRPNGEIEHIPPEKYLEAAEALKWANYEVNKTLPKK